MMCAPSPPSMTGGESRMGLRLASTTRRMPVIDGTGSAAILIHRSALEQVRDAEGTVWYNRIWNHRSKSYFGEDLSFCLRLRSLGIPLHVLTSAETSHAKTFWVSSRQYKLERLSNVENKPDATNVEAFNMLAVL